jgi:hypothetical protein
MPELQQKILKEHVQKEKLHGDLHNSPTSDACGSVHTQKVLLFIILHFMFLQL